MHPFYQQLTNVPYPHVRTVEIALFSPKKDMSVPAIKRTLATIAAPVISVDNRGVVGYMGKLKRTPFTFCGATPSQKS